MYHPLIDQDLIIFFVFESTVSTDTNGNFELILIGAGGHKNRPSNRLQVICITIKVKSNANDL